MAVPDFQTLMLPLLETLADGKEHTSGEIIESLAALFSLSETERNEMLPSGRQARFDNRVHWASTYLRKAQLAESVRRGRYRITERGLDVLEQNPARIDMKYLEQFPEYQEFKEISRNNREEGALTALEATHTPEETLETVYEQLREELAEELLQRVRKCTPRQFEQLVVDLLVAMGYGGTQQDAGRAVGQSGDGGIDGVINEDRLGLDMVCVQAKRWTESVGRPIVQGFAGSLEGVRARKGVLITTSTFTQQARDYVDRIDKKIILIDGQQLAQFMIDYEVGVSKKAQYVVKKIDSDYFDEE